MSLELREVCALLQVFDMPTSLRFYRDVLGFTVASSNVPGDHCDWAYLKLGKAEIMLNTLYEADDRPTAPDPARRQIHADTTLFIGCPDVDAAYRHLRDKGLDVEAPSVAPYGMKQLNCTDPDGYALCFQWPAK
jgi:catechol 2,3-dioxygenase-like lactoylglutathione lyase family enzyme